MRFLVFAIVVSVAVLGVVVVLGMTAPCHTDTECGCTLDCLESNP